MFFFVLKACYSSIYCPPTTQYLYGSTARDVLIPKGEWYYFYTSLPRANVPIEISAKSNVTVPMYKAKNGLCPTTSDRVLLETGQIFWSSAELSSKNNKDIIGLGVYGEENAKVTIRVGSQPIPKHKYSNSSIISTLFIVVTLSIYTVCRFINLKSKPQ
ncbi:hypothetical protein GPJ56_006145 [Histomonas meleagridis]|uniref:uncharacterized protein n=1 Tax=Histomonas meleagridis TaxID=135588 RepID=UPI00355ACAA8|nr:hypothetical protein GPJ56_006145 [Histomonas meleagridis]KAH0797039.1 hypothetical protein GO595_010932 [Histomonas meleagridis]